MGEAPAQFQSQGRAPGESDLVRHNRRSVPHRVLVARQQRRIAQRVVARLVEVSALGNADSRGEREAKTIGIAAATIDQS
jgi:hypothetical protein